VCQYRLTLHINDDKNCLLGVDDYRTVVAINGYDLGCVRAEATKLRASQDQASRGLDPPFEVLNNCTVSQRS
jgi:hypothetical protein